MPCCLDGIGMKGHAFFAAGSADIGYGVDGAYLVVCVHHGDEAGIASDSVCDLLCGDGAVCTRLKQLYIKALCFELFKGMQDGVMLDRGGDDVGLVPLFACGRCGDDRLIVRLAAA